MKRLTSQKEKALHLRKQGMSYTQIKEVVLVSKSTLSTWLSKYPLSEKRIYELRAGSQQRIERNRNTKARKRLEKLDAVYQHVKKDIGVFSKRELFLTGLFLYWGEGTKSARDVTAFTNTDPAMIKFFLAWLESIGISRNDVKVRLHLYKDMDSKKQIDFWSHELGISKKNFNKPYIKDSTFSSLTYKNSFGQGTCSIVYGDSGLHNQIMMSIKYIREIALKDRLL